MGAYLHVGDLTHQLASESMRLRARGSYGWTDPFPVWTNLSRACACQFFEWAGETHRYDSRRHRRTRWQSTVATRCSKCGKAPDFEPDASRVFAPVQVIECGPARIVLVELTGEAP